MFNLRLREERKRLGLSQEEFASAAGVTRRPYADWEAGNTAPTVPQLLALVDIGVDVIYVLTGRHLTPHQRQLMESSYRITNQADLTDAERERSLALLDKASLEMDSINAARAPRYSQIIERLNFCTDDTLWLVEQMVDRLRLADAHQVK